MSTERHTLTVCAKRADVTRELTYFLCKVWDEIVLFSRLCTSSRRPCHLNHASGGPSFLFPCMLLGHTGRVTKTYLISSYTPTLTALLRAGWHAQSNSATESRHFVAIGQAEAAGEDNLPSVYAELDKIGQHVSGHAIFNNIDSKTFLGSSSKSLKGTNGFTLRDTASRIRNTHSSWRSRCTMVTLRSNG